MTSQKHAKLLHLSLLGLILLLALMLRLYRLSSESLEWEEEPAAPVADK